MALSRMVQSTKDWCDDVYILLEQSAADPLEKPIPVATAIAIGSLTIYYFCKKWRNRNKLQPPSPKGWPILGNMLEISDGNMNLDLMRVQKRDNLPDIFTMNFGPSYKMIILNSYDVIKEVLLKNGETFAFRGKGVMQCIGIKDEFSPTDCDETSWKDRKAFIMSALKASGFNMVKDIETKIESQFQALEEYIKPFIDDKKPVVMNDILPQVVFNIIGDILYSKTFPLDEPELKERIEDIRKFLKIMNNVFYLEFLPRWMGMKLYRWTMEKDVSNLFEKVLQPVREAVKEHENTLDRDNLRDFIDVYLSKNPGPVDKEQLAHTTFLFSPDAIDTLARLLDWVLLYITAKPEVQERIHKELDKVVGDGRSVTFADRSNLAYLDAVITEVTRVTSIVWMTGPHIANKDTYINGYYIPKGVPVIAHLYGSMYDPKYFPEPELFKPERFLDESGKFKSIPAMAQFSVGPKKCAGENIVKMEVFMIVSRLLQKYSLSLPEGADTPSLLPAGMNDMDPHYSLLLKPRF